jgi:hypothetical protein
MPGSFTTTRHYSPFIIIIIVVVVVVNGKMYAGPYQQHSHMH